MAACEKTWNIWGVFTTICYAYVQTQNLAQISKRNSKTSPKVVLVLKHFNQRKFLNKVQYAKQQK